MRNKGKEPKPSPKRVDSTRWTRQIRKKGKPSEKALTLAELVRLRRGSELRSPPLSGLKGLNEGPSKAQGKNSPN